jgi:hypothetical protein
VSYTIGCYECPIRETPEISTSSGFVKLEIAKEEDMPESSEDPYHELGQWTCNWKSLWDYADFNNETIIKLSYQNHICGLIRYALYHSEENVPYLLEIRNLEALPKDRRLINPVGSRLVWYAVQVGLKFCTPDKSGVLIFLESYDEAMEYYRDTIQMRYKGFVTIAQGEEGHGFEFNTTEAREFCQRQTRYYGTPINVNP